MIHDSEVSCALQPFASDLFLHPFLNLNHHVPKGVFELIVFMRQRGKYMGTGCTEGAAVATTRWLPLHAANPAHAAK